MGRKSKARRAILVIAIISMLIIQIEPAYAKSTDDKLTVSLNITKYTAYINRKCEPCITISGRYSTEAGKKQYDKMMQKVIWKTSDPTVVRFVNETYVNEEYYLTDTYEGIGPTLMGVKEGKAKITATFKNSSKTVSCEITVKNAELTCEDDVFYTGNTYPFSLKGNATPVKYASEDTGIASINETTGELKTKKSGTTTITCLAEDGQTYSKKIKVQKAGLNYQKITSYYFTGFRKGKYSTFPIVAKGIDVKSWKSSNNKVVKVKKKANIGVLEIHGTGKCTVTCTAKNGKTYKCVVTIVGGKPWSGLSNGYAPDISEVKKHGYYNDINKIQDYGNVVFYIVDYGKKIDYKNGNKKRDIEEAEKEAMKILQNRYPDKDVYSAVSGDLLGFHSGKNYGRLWCGCYYVK